MPGISRSLLRFGRLLSSVPRKLVLQPLTRRAFFQCGIGFHLGERNDFRGIQNIHVGDNVSFGPDTRIWTVGAHIYIGNDVMFGPGVTIISGDHRIDLKGKPMRAVLPSEKLAENDQDVIVVYIGNDVMFGPGVTIISGDHRIDLKGKPMRAVLPSEKLAENDQDVIVEDDVWIGSNATILKGARIPRGSVIASGAVVTKKLDGENCIWGGVPARLIGRRFHE